MGLSGFKNLVMTIAMVNNAMRVAAENPMDEWRRKVPYMIALGRIGFGISLMVAPTATALPYLGAEAKRPSVRFLGRIFGGRDLALGLVLLPALRAERPEDVTRARWLGAGCDAWDAVAAVRGRDLPVWGRIMVGGLATTFAGLGVAAASAPDTGPTAPADAAPIR